VDACLRGLEILSNATIFIGDAVALPARTDVRALGGRVKPGHDEFGDGARAARLEREDEYGAHYAIEFVILFKERSRRVRSLWTIRDEEDFPRFVSVFVMAEDEDHG